MRDFHYHNPTNLVFGRGKIRSLDDYVPIDARVLIMAGGGSIKRNGIYDQVRQALGTRFVVEHWGIEPNPDLSSILPAKEIVTQHGCDFLLAVGGGSVVDATKFLAGICRSPEDPVTLLTRGCRFTSALPLGVVLTVPGTGSESNPHGAISYRAKRQKQLFSSPHCQPRFSILDPETTFSLPVTQIANGVVDTFVHVVEQYLTYPNGGAVSDRLAEALLLSLRELGPKVLSHPDDYDVRADLMWSSTLALNGLIGLGVPQDWTTHHIGHEITALFGLDHARTLAAILPAVLLTRQQQKAVKLLQYGARIFDITEGTDEYRILETIERTRRFFESLGLATRLSSYALTETCIAPIVANLKAARRIRLGERLDITLDDVASILKLAL
jgi:NADP-dependent alcohol dehydrogenase